MSFKDSFIDKVNRAGKVILPIILTLLAIAVGAVLLGAVGSGLWFCIVWCIEKIWKIVLAAVVVFLIFLFVGNES